MRPLALFRCCIRSSERPAKRETEGGILVSVAPALASIKGHEGEAALVGIRSRQPTPRNRRGFGRGGRGGPGPGATRGHTRGAKDASRKRVWFKRKLCLCLPTPQTTTIHKKKLGLLFVATVPVREETNFRLRTCRVIPRHIQLKTASNFHQSATCFGFIFCSLVFKEFPVGLSCSR